MRPPDFDPERLITDRLLLTDALQVFPHVSKQAG
jgi:hypothetical protein